jgi:biopolymer transport protein ExbB/TolQ
VSKKPNRNLRGLLVSVGVVLGAPVVGVAVTLVLLFRSFDGVANVAPSEKARALATGISAAMDGAAIGIGVSCIALVPLVVFAVRLRRAANARRAGANDGRSSSKGPGA